ncbi:MAG: phospholipase D-like domain-containing protein [Candidatus Dormibacteria bacterium]
MPRLRCALGPDAAGVLLREFILAEAAWLDVAVYEAGPSYGWLFCERARAGSRVRLLLDGHGGDNRGCLEEISRAAARGTVVPCRMVPRSGGIDAHWKMLAGAPARLAVGTGNLIARDAPYHHGDHHPLAGTREWWVFLDDAPSLASAVRRAVTTAWRRAIAPPPLWTVEEGLGAPPVNAPGPPVAPLELELGTRHLDLATGGHRVWEMLDAALATAAGRALLTVPYIHAWAHPVRPLVERLADLRRSGHDVRVLLGTPPSGGDAAALADRGVPVRVMDPQRCTTGHAKGLVAADSVVVTSANWSATGLGGALECALRVDHRDAAAYYADAFEHDWGTAATIGASQV